jgi:hypothetical protein
MHAKFRMENLMGRYNLENFSTDEENMKMYYKVTEWKCVNLVNWTQDRGQ